MNHISISHIQKIIYYYMASIFNYLWHANVADFLIIRAVYLTPIPFAKPPSGSPSGFFIAAV
ncbi:hypothetical protein HMP0721_1302 [Pseudoramibacter alactolyticus ATCC 23263]|uniref:Uncharacterized protein n=1 Tax=Pseudoramibacter alactolyticus ATCC 23263 TaxID=887929 RepID=E6MH18_9FIRM|nr:hypothetical protein HMP0721_1302 [Pseudoramibacter alactolyticus ATCC 23263]